jgi:hypothetical protein
LTASVDLLSKCDPFPWTFPLSSDLVPPSNDFEVPLACFRIKLLLEERDDLEWKDGDLLVNKPFGDNLGILSAPPSDNRREGPLLKLFPSVGGRLEPLGGPRSPSSKTFRRN